MKRKIKKNKIVDGTSLFLEIKHFEIKHTTYYAYKNIIDRHINPYFSNKFIEGINTNDIVSFKSFLLRSLSLKRTKDILVLLKEILKVLKIQGYKVNECIDFKFPRYNEHSTNIFTKDEEKKLVKYCLDNNNSYTKGILLSLYTGLRIGELCALTYKDIDFNNYLIKVNKTLVRSKNNNSKENKKTKIFIESTKTISSNRIIPIPYFLKSLIKINNINYYFITESEKYIEPCSYYKKYKKILNSLDIHNRSFHSLRHTFATNCLRQGVDLKTLSELLGHSNVNITINRYVHSTINDKIQNINKLELAI